MFTNILYASRSDLILTIIFLWPIRLVRMGLYLCPEGGGYPHGIQNRRHYRNSLDRAQRSENKPVSVVRADKKSVNTREAQRNAAMQTAKNLRAKENGVAANDY